MNFIDTKAADLPLLTKTQLLQLQTAFPPRCLREQERVEDHLRYAGIVNLITKLASIEERHRETDRATMTSRQAAAEADNLDSMADILAGDAEFIGR